MSLDDDKNAEEVCNNLDAIESDIQKCQVAMSDTNTRSEREFDQNVVNCKQPKKLPGVTSQENDILLFFDYCNEFHGKKSNLSGKSLVTAKKMMCDKSRCKRM